MPKLNAVLMVLFAVAVIAAMAFFTLRPTEAHERESIEVQKLLRKLGDPDPEVRQEGEAGLRKMGASAKVPLQEASKSADRVLAVRAAKLLQDLQAPPVSQPESAPALTE